LVPHSKKKREKNQSEHEHNTFYDPNFIETNPKSQTFQVHFGKNWKMGDYTISYEKGFICKVLQTGDILQTSFAKSLDEMKSENENNRLIRKVILSSPCLWAWFHRLSPLSVVSAK